MYTLLMLKNRGQGTTSTSAARAKFNESKLEFTNIFRAEPPIDSGIPFWIKNSH